MATGIKSGGVDIDTLFMELQGTKRADVNIHSNDTDISRLFEPIGSGTPRADVNIHSGDTDLSDLFRDIDDPLLTVTVTADTITDSDVGGLALAGIRFNADGTVDEYVGGSFSQIASATDWIRPTDEASSLYEVAYWGASGEPFSVQASSEGSWINLGSDRLYYMRADSGEGANSITCTFGIRYDGGSVIDSATFTITATSTP